MMNLGVYIHIPFCVKKCNYCDFVSFSSDNYEEYFSSLKKEIQMYKPFLKERCIDTVFIGGGTPSLPHHKYIIEILHEINFSGNAEVTIEANPKTLTKEKLKAYKESGINRISIGMQSANDNELKILGRVHSHDDFLKSYELVVNAGFDNINIDTMFGIPEQTVESFYYTLSEIKRLNPTHLSSYSLIIEENTPFYKMDLNLPDEECEQKMFGLIKEVLPEYKRYEISNYAKPEYECKHNLKYWQMEDYIGFGLSSHSFVDNIRFSNKSNFSEYIKSVNLNEKPIESYDKEDNSELLKDAVITGLRMCKGINIKKLKDKFGIDFYLKNKDLINKYIKEEFLTLKNGYLSFTEKGFNVSNYILSDFI